VLAYTVVSRDSTKDGAFLRTMAAGTTRRSDWPRDYKGLTFDRTGAQILFVSNRDEFARGPAARYTVYQASAKGGAAQALIAPSQLSAGLHVADNSPVAFNRSGTAVTLSVAPPAIDSVPADSLTGKAVFDLWHYKDRVLQPTQRLNAARDRNVTYSAIYYPRRRSSCSSRTTRCRT
jgi:hypothetical protein